MEPIAEYLAKLDNVTNARDEVEKIIGQIVHAAHVLQGNGWKSQNWPGMPSFSMRHAARVTTSRTPVSDWPPLQAVTDKANAYFLAVNEAEAAFELVDPSRRSALPPIQY